MADSLPTVWSADPHTIAKHRILRRYLDAWMPILSRQSQKIGGGDRFIRFVDGYAGPGIYVGGEKGSPILALESALNHEIEFPIPIRFTFIEADPDRFAVLNQELAKYNSAVNASSDVILENPRNGDCATLLGEVLDQCQRKSEKFGPALVFLDQFGYSTVTMKFIGRILSFSECEVLSYLEFKNLDRFITDGSKHSGLDGAFGSDEWRAAINLSGQARVTFIRELYTKSLRAVGNAKYVWPFAMLDENERLLYWLFFSTNNIRGLEEMKKAMWKMDRTGSFSFSDKDGLDQLKFLISFDDAWLTGELTRKLGGRRLSVREIREYVLTDTPCYLWKGALRSLCTSGLAHAINPPITWKPGTFPDNVLEMQIEFEQSMF